MVLLDSGLISVVYEVHCVTLNMSLTPANDQRRENIFCYYSEALEYREDVGRGFQD